MNKAPKLFVAGADGLIGGAVLREVEAKGFYNATGQGNRAPDLKDPKSVHDFFQRERPEYVIFAAGKTGGIAANQENPADLMFDNLTSSCNVIHASYARGVKKLLYLASSCCYPRHCPQPMKEEYLLTGPLEPTNEAYALAKIAGLKLCQAYRQQYRMNFVCGIPANAFGPGDDFSPEGSHVIGGLMRRMRDAKSRDEDRVVAWGSGMPRREFIYVEDLAKACVFVLENYEEDTPVNLGGGYCLTIARIAEKIKEVCGFKGEIVFDASKPDGMPVKILDSGKLEKMGWKAEWNLDDALKNTYKWFEGR